MVTKMFEELNPQEPKQQNKAISELNDLVVILVNRIKISEKNLSNAERVLRDIRETGNVSATDVTKINKYFEIKNRILCS